MTQPKPLPVVRVEQFDGSHEHPDIQALRAENRQLQKAKHLVEIWQLLGLDTSKLLADVEQMEGGEERLQRSLCEEVLRLRAQTDQRAAKIKELRASADEAWCERDEYKAQNVKLKAEVERLSAAEDHDLRTKRAYRKEFEHQVARIVRLNVIEATAQTFLREQTDKNAAALGAALLVPKEG